MEARGILELSKTSMDSMDSIEAKWVQRGNSALCLQLVTSSALYCCMGAWLLARQGSLIQPEIQCGRSSALPATPEPGCTSACDKGAEVGWASVNLMEQVRQLPHPPYNSQLLLGM